MTSSPPSDQCLVCGAAHSLTPFSGRDFTVAGASGSAELKGLEGEECAACGEVFFTAESSQRFADAGDRMVQMARLQEFIALTETIVLSARREISEPATRS